MRHHSLLCLGDSYTIGEGVPLYESFPYQTVQLLRKAHHPFFAAEVIAKTGWTGAELAEQLLHTHLNEHYDFVTLLIGVNDQYRGNDPKDHHEVFEYLLKKAIHLAKGDAAHVVVISIPDWGLTPFAKDRDRDAIAQQIDVFNSINEEISARYGVHHLDITSAERQQGMGTEDLAADGLHPSGKEYERWAIRLADLIGAQIRKETGNRP